MGPSKLRKLAIIGADAGDGRLADTLQHDRLLNLEMLSLAAMMTVFYMSLDARQS